MPLNRTAPMEHVVFEVKKLLVGQDLLLERLIVALLARGHVLVEGVPGLAKTMAIKTVAQTIGVDFQRIQFTPDLVPADLIGTRIYNQRLGEFQTSLGPVHTNLLLADEINRAPAKVQSALLEVMQERQVTIGRETHRVGDPFLVMATQNPIESEGTYPLPEAQLDRFMLKVLVDYPTPTEEFVIVERMTTNVNPPLQVLGSAELLQMQQAVDSVYVDPALMDYAVRVVTATRQPDVGRSTRPRPLRNLRSKPTRVDQHDPLGEGARVPPGPRLRPPPRCHRPRARRAPPPHRAVVRGTRRQRQRRQHPHQGHRFHPCPRRTAARIASDLR